MARLTTRPEWPLAAVALIVLIGGWYAVNRWVAKVYPPDASEGGRFALITWGSDGNPSRTEQVAIYNRYHLDAGTKAVVVPGAKEMQTLVTASAAKNAVDVVDVYSDEDLRTLIAKGIAQPLNEHLKRTGLDLEHSVWPTRSAQLSQPNPAWREGDDARDRRLYYAVPNNLTANQVWFNRTLYQQIAAERSARGDAVPREPWTDWTWWDYAKLAHSMHRRGADGRFLWFGGQQPELEELLLQIGLSQRGEDPAAFARLSEDEKRALGVTGLSWDDCIALYRPGAEGHAAFVNREALLQALQFRYDLINVLGAVPSPTDANQMQTTGGWASSGNSGQFKAGRLGLYICGRWFLSQVRADIAFDWRMNRMPRWVPYEEWARWERAGLAPAERDGAWGEREHRLRGYGTFLTGRATILTSSARDPERAFSFLRFLVENGDYNRALLVEDGMGANERMCREYLAAPDPLFVSEAARRPPEQEVAALERLFPLDPWPFTNAESAKNVIRGNIDADLNRRELQLAPPLAGERLTDYSLITGSAAESRSSVGEALARRVHVDAERQLALGLAIDRPGSPAYAPSLATWVMLAAIAGVALVVRRRKGG